ncbi:uncharacterized protein C8Q71DRAFT_160896 [Rhodofomes roseus]|uniref:Uncharacterized protein n=1 Tax=Rhodofomes roseus TaxID=34475 RepID=A0ABQ8K9Q3_9APHY|nr:uncharacterized protein C8Q71DRAFT_160896 [Rhodofomes roseus]KAH9834106.1 hypothetical protein C8Q71DRAFT_160896 [Rhodofomes roseus]
MASVACYPEVGITVVLPSSELLMRIYANGGPLAKLPRCQRPSRSQNGRRSDVRALVTFDSLYMRCRFNPTSTECFAIKPWHGGAIPDTNRRRKVTPLKPLAKHGTGHATSAPLTLRILHEVGPNNFAFNFMRLLCCAVLVGGSVVAAVTADRDGSNTGLCVGLCADIVGLLLRALAMLLFDIALSRGMSRHLALLLLTTWVVYIYYDV